MKQPINDDPVRRHYRRNRINQKRHVSIDDGESHLSLTTFIDERIHSDAGFARFTLLQRRHNKFSSYAACLRAEIMKFSGQTVARQRLGDSGDVRRVIACLGHGHVSALPAIMRRMGIRHRCWRFNAPCNIIAQPPKRIA